MKQQTPQEALETVNEFYLAVTDYFRDGRPSRLQQRVYDLGMPASNAIDTLRAHLNQSESKEPEREG